MILLTHILIAVSSIVLATGALVSPSRATLRATYIAIAATLASGVYLTLLSPARLVQTCMTGIAYLAVVSVLSVFAQKRLARQHI